MVNFCVVFGALVAYAAITAIAAMSNAIRSVSDASGWFATASARSSQKQRLSNDFSVIDHAGEFLTLATGALIYVIVFKVIDYLREADLNLSEWRESLQGYVMVVVKASLCSQSFAYLLMVLLLSPLSLLSYIWTDLAGLAQQFHVPAVCRCSCCSLALSYLRHAVSLQWRNGEWHTKEIVENRSGRFFGFSRTRGLYQTRSRTAGSLSDRRAQSSSHRSWQEQCDLGGESRSCDPADELRYKIKAGSVSK